MRLPFATCVGIVLLTASLATANHCFKHQHGSVCSDYDCPCTPKSQAQCSGSVTQIRGTGPGNRCNLYVGGQAAGKKYGIMDADGCGQGFQRSAQCTWFGSATTGVCICTNFGPEDALGSEVGIRECGDCFHL